MPLPMCSAPDARSVGYQLIPCNQPSVALYREAGIEGDDQAYCLSCLMNRIRVAIDLKGYVLSVVSEPPQLPAAPVPPPEE